MNTAKKRIMGLAGLAVSAALVLSACNRQGDGRSQSVSSGDTPLQDSTVVASNDKAASAPSGKPTDDKSLLQQDQNDMLIGNEPTAAGIPTQPSPTAASSTLNRSEKQFLANAALEAQYQLAVAQLATAQAADSSVKSYAAMLVSDHALTNQKLHQLAQGHKLILPTTLPPGKQQVIDRLTRLSGPEFDHQFIQTVGMHDNQTDISLFEKASREAKDGEIREFAASALPTFRAHLTAAQNLPATVKGQAAP